MLVCAYYSNHPFQIRNPNPSICYARATVVCAGHVEAVRHNVLHARHAVVVVCDAREVLWVSRRVRDLDAVQRVLVKKGAWRLVRQVWPLETNTCEKRLLRVRCMPAQPSYSLVCNQRLWIACCRAICTCPGQVVHAPGMRVLEALDACVALDTACTARRPCAICTGPLLHCRRLHRVVDKLVAEPVRLSP